jgi:uncharacterized protein (TIGR00251 family)
VVQRGAGDLFDAGPSGGAAVVHVHVQPRAGRDEVVGRHGDALRVRVTAPPIGGRATDAARRLVAAVFGLRADQVTLESGDRSRLKRFRLGGIDRATAVSRLARVLAPPDAGSPD